MANIVNQYGQVKVGVRTQAGGGGNSIVTNGLILNLDAGNASSYPGTGTTWTDLSGQNNNGTLVNGVGYSSSNGGTLVFDGVNDWVSLPNIGMPSSGARTFNIWVKPSSLISIRTLCGYGNILRKLESNLLHINVINGGDVYWGFNDADFYTVGNSITTSQYYNISAIYNGGALNTSNVFIYINGVLQSLSTSGYSIGSIPSTVNSNYSIGNDNNIRQYLGNIPTVQFYNRALSASEVLQNFNATKTRFGL